MPRTTLLLIVLILAGCDADRNLFEVPASEISDAQIVMTIVDGRADNEKAGNQ